MFNYAIEVLEEVKNNGEENLCSGLWRLEKIPLKQYKNQLKELEEAIEILEFLRIGILKKAGGNDINKREV